MTFEPRDPSFASRVRSSFERQKVMAEIGARLIEVEPGEVAIEFPFQERFTQQHGFLHAGIVSTVLDSASGYAAATLMPADSGVLSIEFKVNLLTPAVGETFVARASVVRSGRTITVTQGSVFTEREGREIRVATMQATMMTVENRDGIQG